MMATSKHISVPKLFSEGDAKEWFQQYEICCTANKWDAATWVIKLPTLKHWLELTEAEKADYDTAKKKIVEKWPQQISSH